MRKIVFLALAFFLWFVVFGSKVEAQTPQYYRAVVEEVGGTQVMQEGVDGYSSGPTQEVRLKLTSGPEKGKQINLLHGEMISLSEDQLVKKQDQVVVMNSESGYLIIDFYRTNQIRALVVFFFVLVVITAGRKGLGSFIGMGLSLLVILKYMVPSILDGADPLIVSLSGSLVILVITLYLAHGFNKQTSVALGSTLIVLLAVGLFSWIAVNISRLTGMGADDAASLRIGVTEVINLKGLLLGSMVIGVVGVLDDITTAQVAAVWELKKANRNLSFKELWKRGRRIGTEHIASLVNTLVMAYAGAAMPVFIFLVLNPANEPLWMMINSELISEEIIRTLSGSVGLVLAVPITTLIAAWFATKYSIDKVVIKHHGHEH